MIQNSGQTGFESEGLGSTVGFEAYMPIGLGFFRFNVRLLGLRVYGLEP